MPTVTADGHSYERVAIETWFKNSSLSPATGKPLNDQRLTSNHALRNAIGELAALPAELRRAVGEEAIGVSGPAVLRPSVGLLVLHLVLHLALRLPETEVVVGWAFSGDDRGATLVILLALALCVLGTQLRAELLTFAAVLAGVPLAAMSFCAGMVAALGSETSALLSLSWLMLLASVVFCASGLYLLHTGVPTPSRVGNDAGYRALGLTAWGIAIATCSPFPAQ